MKLHLPKPLRNSVLACIAAVAGIATPTLGTATFAGGVVAFSFAQQAMAAPTVQDNVIYTQGESVTLSWSEADGYKADSEVLTTQPAAGAAEVMMWKQGETIPAASQTLTLESGTYANVGFSQGSGSDTLGSAEAPLDLNLVVTGSASVTKLGDPGMGLMGWGGSRSMYANLNVDIDTTGTVGGILLLGEGHQDSNRLHGDINVSIKSGTVNTASYYNIDYSLISSAKNTGVNGNVNYTLGVVGTTGPTINGRVCGAGGTREDNKNFSGDVTITINSGLYKKNIIGADNGANVSGAVTINYHGGTLEGLLKGGVLSKITGEAALNVYGELNKARVDAATFDKVYVREGGVLTFDSSFTTLTNLVNEGTVSIVASEGMAITLAQAVIDSSVKNGKTTEYTIVDGGTTTLTGAETSDQLKALFRGTGLMSAGTEWAFNNGKLLVTMVADELTYSGGTLEFGVGSELDNDAAFTDGACVIFQEADADVTLTGDVTSSLITIEEGVTVNLTSGDYSLTGNLQLEGTLVLKDAKGGNMTVVESPNGTVVVDWGGTGMTGNDSLPAEFVGNLIVRSGRIQSTNAANNVASVRRFASVTVEDGGQFAIRGTYAGDITISGMGVADSSDNAAAMKFCNNGVVTGNVTAVGDTSLLAWGSETGKFQGSFTADADVYVNKHDTGNIYFVNGLNVAGTVHVHKGTVRLGDNQDNLVGVNGGFKVYSGATLEFHCNAGDATGVNIELAGGKLQMYDMGSTTDTLKLGKLAVTGNDSSIKFWFNGGLEFNEVTGSGSLKLQGGGDTYPDILRFNSLKDYTGVITRDAEAAFLDVFSVGTVDVGADLITTINADFTAKDFSKVGKGTLVIGGNVTAEGSLSVNYEGALTMGEGSSFNVSEGTVLSYTGDNSKVISLGALNAGVNINLFSVDAATLASGVNLGITLTSEDDVEELKAKLNVAGLSDYTLTSKNNQAWLTSTSPLICEWDMNWGGTVVAAGPTGLVAQAIAVDQMNSAGEGLGEGAYLVDGRVAIKLGENGATANNFKGSCDDPVGIAGGAFAQKGTHGKTVEIPNGVWIQAEDGMYGIIAGGSISVNYDNRSSAVVRTDSHIIIDDKSTDDSALAVLNVVGANYGDCVGKEDDKTHKFYGDTYISVKSDSVWTDVIGGSVTYHGGRTIMEGDTHIFVYTPLTSHTDTKHRNEVYAVIGGMEAADNNASAHELTGNTNVTIDLSGSDATTAFAKKIIGGNVAHGTSTLTGTASVSINGVNKAGTAITFSDLVVGGSYVRTNGSTSTIGSSKLAISGGSFSNAVIGGTYLHENGSSVQDASSLSVNGGTFNGAVVGGSYLNTNGTSNNEATTVNISGGTFGGFVSGGDYITGTDKATVTSNATVGSTSVTISGGTFTANPSANCDLMTGAIIGGHVLNANVAGAVLNVDSTSVLITGGTIGCDIFGGNVDVKCQSNSYAITSHVENATVTLNGATAQVGNIYGGSYTVRDASGQTLTQGAVLVDLVAGTVNGNVYAGGRQVHNTKISTESTEVRLSKDVLFGSSSAIVSGGYQIGCSKADHGRNNPSTVVSSTLVLTGTQNRTGVSFVDFDTIKVTDATDAAAAAASATIGSLTSSTAVTKTGAGTLTLAGGIYSLTGGLTVSEGKLSIADDTTLGGALTLSNGAGLNVSAGELILNGELSLGSGLVLTLGALDSRGDATILSGVTSSSVTAEGVDASSIFASITSGESVLNVDDYKVQLSGTNLILVNTVLPTLIWDTDLETWQAGAEFDAADATFEQGYGATFGSTQGLTENTESVTVQGPIEAGKITINPGEGGKYAFTAAEGDGNQITAGNIEVVTGTLALGAGVVGTDVEIALDNGTALEWLSGNLTDYSGQLTVDGNVTFIGHATEANSPISFSKAVAGLTDSSVTTLQGGYFSVYGAEVLKGTISIADDTELRVKKDSATNTNQYNQNFTGAGDIRISNGATIHFTGTNDYTGDTIFDGGNCTLHIDALSAYSADSKMTGSGNLKLNAAGEYAWNTASNMTGTVTIASGATVKVTGATSVAFAGAGGMTVDGGTAETPITWVNTGKTYTGLTQLAAGTYVSAAGGLSSGAGAVNLEAADSTLVVTDSTGWTNKVYGAGSLVLATTVDNVEALINKDSTNTLANLVVGTAAQAGILKIDDANAAAAANKAQIITVTSGSNLTLDSKDQKLSSKIVLAGAGNGGADTSAAMSLIKNGYTTGTVELGADATVYVRAEDAGFNGAVDTNGYTLTKTGSGQLNFGGGTDYTASKAGSDLSGNLDIQGGTVRFILSNSSTEADWSGKVKMANGTSLWRHTGKLLLSGGLDVDGTVTYYVENAHGTTISGDVVGDADSIIKLTTGKGEVLDLTTGAKSFAGTWQVGDGTADGNWNLKASHADALKSATVKLNDSDAKLVLGVDTANLAKLTGTAGIVTGSGKTLNIANSETAGVVYSGAIGDGVTIQVSEGYQKITGAGKTGNITLSVPSGEVDMTGGGALMVEAGEETAPVLDLEGYAHSDAADAGVTTILAGKGMVSNLTLGKNMVLTCLTNDTVAPQNAYTGQLNSLTLAGGTLKFHLGSAIAYAETEGGTAESGIDTSAKTVYNLNGGALIVTGEKTKLTLLPVDETVKLVSGQANGHGFSLIEGIGSVEGVDGWAAMNNDMKAAALAGVFDINVSTKGRTTIQYKYSDGTLGLYVDGSAATLVWNETDGEGIWNTGSADDAAAGEQNWLNKGKDDRFLDDDHVVFSSSTTGENKVTISDKDGVRIGSMSIVGAANYTFTGDDAITSGEGMGQVNIGTTEDEYTGTVTFENANSWKGNTNINSGVVVAKNAAALSNTTVNLKGGSLTVDGVALDAVVDMLGGALVGNGTASATVDLSDADTDMSLNATDDSTLTVTPTEAGIAGKVTINALDDTMTGTVKIATGEGKVTSTGTITVEGGTLDITGTLESTGTITVEGGTLDITGTLESSSTIAVNAGKLDITGTVKAAGVSTGEGAVVELSDSTLEITGDSLSGSIKSAGGTLKSSAENGTTLSKLTIGGENTDTTLSGSWTISNSSVTWDKDATGKLVLAASSTLKLEENTTLQRVEAAAEGSNIVKAADAVTLSVGFINLNKTIGEGITLEVTGQSDTQDDSTWISGGAKAGAVVIDVAESYTEVSGNAAYLATSTTDSVEIKRGRVLLHSGDITVNKGITLDGDGAILATQLTDIATAAKTPADITLINGKLEGFGNYAGTIEINDEGICRDYDLGGLTDKASVHLGLLSVIGAADELNETAGYSSLTNLVSLKLAGTNIVTLSEAMTADDAKAIFNTTGAISLAEGADLTFGVNSLAAKMNNGDTVKLHVGGDLTGLAGKALFDASLSLMNIEATLGADGFLTLTKIKPTQDNIFVSTDDGATGDEVPEEVVISGEDAYTATEGYAGIVVDHNTTIDLTDSTRNENQTDGMVLSNLMGTATSSEDGSSTTLSIAGSNATAQEGAPKDLVTINPNLDHAEMEENAGGVMEEAGVKDALSFDGDIKVSGADLQYKATDSKTGDLAETTYNVNGNLTADEHSQVIVTSGVLALNGTKNELEGGITVDQTNGTLVLNGENTTIGGTVAAAKDAEGNVTNGEGISIAAGAAATLADKAVLTDGVSIVGDSASSIVVTGTTTIEEGASISGGQLTLSGSESKLTIEDTAGLVQANGLSGEGSLVAQGGAKVKLEMAGDATFTGSLEEFIGELNVTGTGSQTIVLSDTSGALSSRLTVGNPPVTTFRMFRMVRSAPSAPELKLDLTQVKGDNPAVTINEAVGVYGEGASLVIIAGREDGKNTKLNIAQDAAGTDGTGVLTLGEGTNLTLSMNLKAGDADNTIITAKGIDILGNGANVNVDVRDIDSALVDQILENKSITITLATADSINGETTGNILDDSVIRKYLGDSAKVEVQGNSLVLTGSLVSSEDASWYQDNATTDNGKAGGKLLDYAFGSGAQADKDSDMADVLNTVEDMISYGSNRSDDVMASVAGASTAVLGMAAVGDVDRQLRAIRNRTTTMGVDQTVVNHDMPYFNAWINAEGHMSEMGDDGTLGGYKLNSWGGTVGFDVDLDSTFTAGLALTAMYGDLDATGADKATGNMDTTYVSAFARYCASAWTHTFVATVGMGDISLDRTVLGHELKGETESMSFGFMYEVGRVFALDEDATACIQPVFNVAWRHASVDGYTEKGGDLALEVGEQSLDTITFGLGARVQAVVGESMYNRTSIFECRLLAKADVGDRESAADVALGGGKAEVKSAETGAFGLEAGAGLTIPMGDEGSSIFMDASVELRADYTNVNGTVGYRINF